jgi:pyruvate, water dikinase
MQELLIKNMSQYIKTFKQLKYKDTGIAGGKGASLGEMAQAGIPVPPGFVVLVGAFDKFMTEAGLDIKISDILKKLKHNEARAVEDASKKIRSLIKSAKFPKDIAGEIVAEFKKLKAPLVAVRSSATAEDAADTSWAGELESYLNVTNKNLLESVKKCWSSLYTPRAIFYRFENNLSKQKVSVAAVVQKMIQSEISGITFTVHPVTKDKKQMVIEAGYGLGEAIVGGKITPDTYILKKSNLEISDKNISNQSMMIVKKGIEGTVEVKVSNLKREKQKLADIQIKSIGKICLVIEKHYKKPQDIEWAMEKNKIYITQSRPITTL